MDIIWHCIMYNILSMLAYDYTSHTAQSFDLLLIFGNLTRYKL